MSLRSVAPVGDDCNVASHGLNPGHSGDLSTAHLSRHVGRSLSAFAKATADRRSAPREGWSAPPGRVRKDPLYVDSSATSYQGRFGIGMSDTPTD